MVVVTGKQRACSEIDQLACRWWCSWYGMEISHLLDNNNTGSIGSPREGRQGDCLGLVMRRSGGLGQEKPGFSQPGPRISHQKARISHHGGRISHQGARISHQGARISHQGAGISHHATRVQKRRQFCISRPGPPRSLRLLTFLRPEDAARVQKRRQFCVSRPGPPRSLRLLTLLRREDAILKFLEFTERVVHSRSWARFESAGQGGRVPLGGLDWLDWLGVLAWLGFVGWVGGFAWVGCVS